MYSSAGTRAAHDTLKEFEQVRGFFLQALAGPPAKATPVRLVAFGSAKEYEPYRLNEYAIAYYHQTADRDYIVMSHAGADTFPIAVHEYVHLLVRHSNLDLPPWLNEGIAELYSSIRPMGDKILVGDLIPGRHRALLDDKWVPLSTIVAADQGSPYYNEKNKAGSLYNEGWALTHMLYFRPEYRPKFGELMHAVAGGTPTADAFLRVYGRSVAQVDKDLQAYLRGSSFQGALVPVKLEKVTDELAPEDLPPFDVKLMFADLTYRPGKEPAVRAMLEQLRTEDPKRFESYSGLAYLSWRSRDTEEAVRNFAKAYELGDRSQRLLWDYGRLLEPRNSAESAKVLSELLAASPDRLEARLELSEVQLRANDALAALRTLQPIRKVTPADAARFFRIATYAHLLNHDAKTARETAEHFKTLAKSDEDRAEAESLLRTVASGDAASRPRPVSAAPPVETPDTGRPQLRRSDTLLQQEEKFAAMRPSVTGRFVDLDCRGAQARMTVETPQGKQVFLIEDPAKVAITAGSDGPVEMTCGPQKKPVAVVVGFDPAAQSGIAGLVRTLEWGK